MREHYDEYGYAVFPKVVGPAQVMLIRAALKEAMDAEGRNYFWQTWRLPEVATLLNRKRFLNPFRTLFGDDFILLPEQGAQRQTFGGWHADTNVQAGAGHNFQDTPDFRMGTAAIYLQDQHPEYAGGLDLIPRGESESVTVPTHSGDLLVFDMRLQHRATQPTIAESTIPESHHKYALFYIVSANTPHAQLYRDFIGGRPEDAYATLADLHYPDRLTKMARKRGYTLMP